MSAASHLRIISSNSAAPNANRQSGKLFEAIGGSFIICWSHRAFAGQSVNWLPARIEIHAPTYSRPHGCAEPNKQVQIHRPTLRRRRPLQPAGLEAGGSKDPPGNRT